MIEAKPYNLQLSEGKSDEYYEEIAAFAGRWLPHAMERAGELVSGFLKHRNVSALGLRSEAECAFERRPWGCCCASTATRQRA